MRSVSKTLVVFSYLAHFGRPTRSRVRCLLPILAVVAALAFPTMQTLACQTRAACASSRMSLTWFETLDEFLRRTHSTFGGNPLDYPQSTADHPMAGAQLVYDDLGGVDSLLDFTLMPPPQQMDDAAEMFIFLGGDMDTQTWTTTERQRSALLLDYYTLQGGVFPLF
jgi:hypothetical protein